jgi:hypothetical protein
MALKQRRLEMRFQTLMVVKAAVCLVLGIPILIAPVFLYSLFGASLTPGGVFAAREYGASLIGNLLLAWFARRALRSEIRTAIALDLCVYDAIGFVITLIALFSGVLGILGWFAALIYLFFAIAFGYFSMPQRKTA